MKKLLLITLLIVTIFKLNAQEQKQYFDNGNLKSSGQNNKNGDRTGEWKEYHENGELESIGEYINGQKTRRWRFYYSNGQLKKLGQYVYQSEKKFQWQYYYENGELESIGEYGDNEQKVREWNYYGINGKLTFKFYTENGEEKEFSDLSLKEIKEYYDSGNLKTKGHIFPISKVRYGEWKTYHENGELAGSINIFEGKIMGLVKWYSENGELITTEVYSSDKRNGISKTYFGNGQLAIIGEFNFDLQSGKWKFYHENGNIKQILLWDEGKLMEVLISKDKNGNDLDKGTITNGNGIIKSYDTDGVLVGETKIINGIVEQE